MKSMHFGLALTLAVSSVVAVAAPKQLASVEVSNPSQFERSDEQLALSFSSLGLSDGADASHLLARSGGQVLASQAVDSDGDGALDTLLVMVDMPAAGDVKLSIQIDDSVAQNTTKRTQAEISRKEGGTWEGRKYIGGNFVNVTELSPPEAHTDHSEFIRYEGPGIESDKVGYRVYLDERNGFDIFGKSTTEMVLQGVGQDGFSSYHDMADWGMDVLKVGPSLGMGGYGYWHDGAVQRVSDLSGWTARITDNGPVYSAFEIDYRAWQVANTEVDLKSRLSMQAGSRLVRVDLETSQRLDNIAAGLVKHEGTKVLQGTLDVTGTAYSYIATWGEQSLDGGKLGMALLFQRKDLRAYEQDDYNQVAVLRPRGTNLHYYFLAAWDGEPDGIKTQAEFQQYLEQQVERLTVQPRLRVHSTFGDAKKSFPMTAGAALGWAEAVADAEIARHGTQLAWGDWDELRQRDSNWEYHMGLLMQSYDALGLATGDKRYNEVAEKVISSYIAEDGTIASYDMSKYNIDSVNSGKMLLRLYQRTGDERYRKAADTLRQQLKEHPRTDAGAFWHKQRYPGQLWLDGVYMGMPFLAEYSLLFEEGASVDQALEEFEVSRDKLRDPETGLYWHAWDEKKQQVWANDETGRSEFFWARGLGWLSMALVDTYALLPEDDQKHREILREMTVKLADAILAVQDDTGVWFQILDMPEAVGNYREASASSMFTYMLARGVNLGVLPESYKKHAQQAYEGLVREFIEPLPAGGASLTSNCAVAGLGFGRDGSYRYYMSEPIIHDDPKGLGPFIFASIEMSRLLK